MTPRRSRRSDRQSTTSPRTSKRRQKTLGELIDALPPERAAAVFTHSSWATERSDSYERLEFLGDSVLELAIAHTLYERFPDFEEGQMAKLRSHVVSRASCAIVARELGLGERLLEHAVGHESEELTRLADQPQRARGGARGGARGALPRARLRAVAGPLVEAFESRIQFALFNQVDYKTELQETLARRGRSVSYSLLDAEGPPHQRLFTAAAVSTVESSASGRARRRRTPSRTRPARR